MKKNSVAIAALISLAVLAGCGKKEENRTVAAPAAPAAPATVENKIDDTTGLIQVYKAENGLVFYKPNNAACAKVVGINTQYQEGTAQTLGVPMRSIGYIRTKLSTDPDGECWVIIDTPQGPKQCIIGSIVKTSQGYAVTPLKFNPEKGTSFNSSGMCSNPF